MHGSKFIFNTGCHIQVCPAIFTVIPFYLNEKTFKPESNQERSLIFSDPAWPDGFNYGVGWDCTTHSLIDADNNTSTQQCIWANGCLVRRYVQGKGSVWRGVTYPDWI